MYFEEQPDQNPEKVAAETTQEEKTDSVEKTEIKKVENEKPKTRKRKQIKVKEKREIIDLLHDRIPKPKAKKQVVVPKPQLNVEEVKAVKNLLQDKPATVTEATVELKKEIVQEVVEHKQISGRERKEIIILLHGGKPETVVAVAKEEEIDFESLNKQELVEMLEEVVLEKNISKIKNKIARIRAAFHHRNKEEKDKELEGFLAGGGNKEDYKHIEDPLEQRYNSAFNQYRHNKAKYGEELERQKVENLKVKHEILEELKELINSDETLKKTYDEFKRLQDRWKEIGMVPASELNNLWQNYHFLVEKFFDKVRINKELRDLDLKKNLEKKIVICEKTEELLLEKSIINSFRLLQKYHDQWREIGPVPIDKKDEIWERFKAATDKINENRKEHYKEIQEEQQKNYEAKLALCEKAEDVIAEVNETLKEWQKRTDEVNELFKVWKTIGRAPKAQNNEIWARFKGSLDTFFNNKREYLDKLKEQQMNNLNLKIDLCAKAESQKDSSEWSKTTQDLIRLQQEWKKIGPVPRRQSDKVWKRFRSACDTFFNRKSEHFTNIHGVEDENLKQKKKFIEAIVNYKITDDKKESLEALKGFQRKWMEVGHVPYKEKDKIQQKYREAIDQLIDKMDINKLELTQSGYKSKIELLKNDPDADWRLRKERTGLMSRITKLQDDIAVWENNIGFFSSSKQSGLLRVEFEKKIEKAKKELDAFQSKLKILNSA